MNVPRLLLCLLLIGPGAALAQADDATVLQQAQAIAQRTLTQGGATALVESLVQTAPYRFAGSKANQRAVQWALKTLKQAGLKNVHTEAVTVPRWERGCATATPPARYTTPSTCPLGDALVRIEGSSPRPLMATALGGSVGTPASGITAPVLMVQSLDELRARPLADIKDKIVFINRQMDRRADGSGYGEAVGVRAFGATEAARRGAVGVVIRSIGTNQDRVPHTGALRYDEIVRKIPAAAISAVDADLLEARVEQGDTTLHLRVDAQDRGTTRAANVIAEIPGSTDEIVLLAAHLDSWDITPGANDDGAGVGIMIAAMRLLAGEKPRRTLRLLLTANEEFGLSGAQAYVKAHAAEIDQHVLGLEADFGSGAVQMLNAGVSEADWPRVQQMAQSLALWGVTPGKNGNRGGADLSPLHARGLPVFAPRQDGSKYFDVHHTTADGIDGLDHAGLEQNVRVYAFLAWVAANVEKRFGRLNDK